VPRVAPKPAPWPVGWHIACSASNLMDGEAEQQVHNLHERLREAVEEVEALRHEAADLAADLRNQLQALTLEREALRRLDGNRQERIERRSSP
jgi:DNA repair ATPase RecN